MVKSTQSTLQDSTCSNGRYYLWNITQVVESYLAVGRVDVSCRSPGSKSWEPFSPNSSQPRKNTLRLSCRAKAQFHWDRRQKEKLHQINHARPQLIYTFYYNYRIVLFYYSILNANSARRTISFNMNIHWTTRNMRVTQVRQITYWLKHLNQHVAWLIISSNQSSSKK